MSTFIKYSLLLIAWALLYSCSASTSEYHFFAGNTSSDKKTGYLKISIDGVVIFSDSVRYLKDSITAIDEWDKRFSKALPAKDDYLLTVEADNNASLTRTEKIKKNERWIYIDYYHYDEGLTINVAKTTAPPSNK